jgi:hypothetical protein
VARAFPHLLKPIKLGTRESRKHVAQLATMIKIGVADVASERTLFVWPDSASHAP